MIKEQYLPYFENKNVTVMGLGLLGRGVGDTAFLAELCKNVIVTDKKTSDVLATSVDSLKEYKNITYRLGEHDVRDFEEKDFILKAAGVPFDSEYILHAVEKNVPVYMSAALVSDIVIKELPECVIIGVTGTRGKTTTTELIAHVLRENNSRVHLGGNIRGIANLPLLKEIEEADFLVLELDSWQLQGFGDMNISPHIALFTSFLDDHMTYYKGDKERYFNDKANIYRNQHDGDVFIASAQASSEIIMRGDRVSMVVPEKRVFKTKLLGEHNQIAIGLAYEATLQCGLDEEDILRAIESFEAVEGRLESMGEFRGVHVFNDNNATTEDATVASINAIYEEYKKKPIVIVGGVDKGLSIKNLEKSLTENTKAIVYLAGTGTDTITLPKEYLFEKLEDCIQKAFELAEEEDVILFSPAFASYSKYFNNEYERNDLFVKEVQKYK